MRSPSVRPSIPYGRRVHKAKVSIEKVYPNGGKRKQRKFKSLMEVMPQLMGEFFLTAWNPLGT